jgi:hypothetical protein
MVRHARRQVFPAAHQPVRPGPRAGPHAAWLAQARAMPLSHFQLMIVEEIAAHHGRRCRGGTGRLSIEALELDTGSSPRRARTALAKLVDLGLLAIEHGLGTMGSKY